MLNEKLMTPVQYLKGVGPKLAKTLKKLDIETIFDLIYCFPRDYEDRTQLKSIANLTPSAFEIIKGEVVKASHQLIRNRFSVLKVKIADGTGAINAVWFNQPYLAQMFRPGMRLIVSGKIEHSDFDGTLQLSVRDFEVDTGENIKFMPIYNLTSGLYPKKIRSIIQSALINYLDYIQDALPDGLKKEYQLIDVREAINTLHFPQDLILIAKARRRIVFEEFFLFQLGLGLRKSTLKKAKGINFNPVQDKLDYFVKSLPFSLTASQQKVISEILADMQSPYPMNRLLQGDVGSGKTIVAAIAALNALSNGYQVAVMAPTEILANQHYDKLCDLLKKEKVKIDLLTSATSKKERKMDKLDLFIGTHALIQGNVVFNKLGLVIIDEQHRFGVEQRAKLVGKGAIPDVLVMTATPIPRSLSLTLYGELDRSIINEMPPGRLPAETLFVPEKKRASSYEFIRDKVKQGRQVFVVCPLIKESEKIDLKAAEETAAKLQQDIFPEFKIALMHGKMKPAEKDAIMRDFKENKIQILVSTTVIEVGIDIPNATIMLIEHAERFGLSQLHQLRGRIGRGREKSYCFLMANPKTDEAKARIKAMLDTTDGFKIAEIDLKIRGPGDLYGTRQSGLPNFKLADIIKDEKILIESRKAAFQLVEIDYNSAHNIWESQRKKVKSPVAGQTFN